MSLIDFLPNGGSSLNPGSNLAFTGTNTHAGLETFNGYANALGGLRLGTQTYAATGTIASALGSVVVFTGASGQTLSLPAAPATNLLLWIRNESGNSVTVSGNGNNLDGSASVTVTALGSGCVWFDGTAWWTLGVAPWGSTTFGITITFSGAFQSNAQAKFNGSLLRTRQPFSTSGTVSINGGPYVAFTGTSGGTLTLPASPSTDMELTIKDEGGSAGTSSITVSGNGKNIDGASTATLSSNYGKLNLHFNGTSWFTF